MIGSSPQNFEHRLCADAAAAAAVRDDDDVTLMSFGDFDSSEGTPTACKPNGLIFHNRK